MVFGFKVSGNVGAQKSGRVWGLGPRGTFYGLGFH